MTGPEPEAVATDPDRALGRALVADGRLDAAGLDRALRLCAASDETLPPILVKLGLVPESALAETLAAHLGLATMDPAAYPDAPVLAERLGAPFLHQARLIPVGEDDAGRLIIAMADPRDAFARQAVALAAGQPVVVRVGVPADIEAAIDRLYGPPGAGPGGVDGADGGAVGGVGHGGGGPGSTGVSGVGAAEDAAAEDVERLRDLASEAPVVRLVNTLIARAVEARASDIHLEPFNDRLRVRTRIDGVLREGETVPGRLRAAAVSRIKIMARLDIAERRLPQDGRFRLAVRGREIDLRISTVPTLHGESVVLRLLDSSGSARDIAALGLDPALEARYGQVLAQPHGILLATGPTGSGKTTTLYASLLAVSSVEKKIITVEDPVEYQLDGVNQIQVRSQIGLSFAAVLRSVLRQDPDVIMIGEVRDRETAEIAVQAALTGHLVLATLHTNDAAGTIPRLIDMGVEDYLLTASLNGIVAQRLVRTLCPACRAPCPPPPLITARPGFRAACGAGAHFHRPIGCDRCDGTGFVGRTAIMELLIVSDAIRRAILARADARAIEQLAREEGMRTMFEHGIAKAAAGLTTVDEVLRTARGG